MYRVTHISDVFYFTVQEDTLIDMVMHMTEKVGLVHQFPYVCTRKGIASSLEKVQ